MIKLRKATDTDLEFIAYVCKSNSILYDSIMPGAFLKQADKYLNSGLPNSYEMFICEDYDKKIGFLGTKIVNHDTTYLVALYLNYELQRDGYGKKIITALVNQIKSESFKKIILLVHKDAYWAKSFYEKVGFNYLSNEEDFIRGYDNRILEKLYISNTELYVYII